MTTDNIPPRLVNAVLSVAENYKMTSPKKPIQIIGQK